MSDRFTVLIADFLDELVDMFRLQAGAKGIEFAPMGFASGDRRHRL